MERGTFLWLVFLALILPLIYDAVLDAQLSSVLGWMLFYLLILMLVVFSVEIRLSRQDRAKAHLLVSGAQSSREASFGVNDIPSSSSNVDLHPQVSRQIVPRVLRDIYSKDLQDRPSSEEDHGHTTYI